MLYLPADLEQKLMSSEDVYIVVGNPIAQSRSPFIHTLFARQTMQPMHYQSLLIPEGEFKPYIEAFFQSGGRGCNVTAPFKQDAYAFADRLTERAELSGAVNTLKRLDDGGILGDNTDGAGLVQDLLNYQVVLEGAKILILGAGGATRGVLKPLLEQKPAQITISNRTFEKAQLLADTFTEFGPVEALAMSEVKAGYDVIINATSAGLTAQLPQIDESIFSSDTVVYDMVYGAGTTRFNQWAKSNGVIQAFDGLGMLVGQAAESFMLWRGIRPGARQVLRELRKNIQE